MLAFDLQAVVIGLVAGVLIGSTGVGGAAFATPAMVVALGIPAPVAIATDAVFCAVIKLFGLRAHKSAFRDGRRVLGLALIGSLPGALLGVLTMNQLGNSASGELMLRRALGVLLIAAAVLTVQRTFGWLPVKKREAPLPGWLLLVGSLVLGFLVGLTSIGAGCLFLPLFLAAARLPFSSVVAIDIAQGLILAIVAGAMHFTMGRVDPTVLVALVVGGIPGVYLGAHLHKLVSARTLVSTTASLIALIGLRLVF